MREDPMPMGTYWDLAVANHPESFLKQLIAVEVDGQLKDLSAPQSSAGSALRWISLQHAEGLDIIRHSTAHLLAQAVKQCYPEAQITIGPVIEEGFYYDIACEHHFTPEDLEYIDQAMQALVKQDLAIERLLMTREEAIAFFEAQGERYKVAIIRDIPEGETLTLYRQGDFTDLCRGPHVPRTGFLGAFKLTKLAGAYWRGDSQNEMLQRIYGTAWANQKDLKTYLTRIEEAQKRDHRRLAVAMDLFHFQQEAPGMAFWHPHGWILNLSLRRYIRSIQNRGGYQEVNTPQLVDSHLWELSGHTTKFNDDMFVTESENRQYIVKPMSCPCHVQIFKQGVKSYRDLPIRYSEYGSCHRNEPSGTLHGLMRVRNFVQDDGHIFCREDQIQSEVSRFLAQIFQTYRELGFDDILIKLATRPEKRVGSDADWDKTEAALEQALKAAGLEWEYNPGEGAFYGPKLEFSLKDSLGRVWQCGTIQVDPSTPARLGATYIAEDGSKQVPYMLHRAMLGSLERFIGILLEEYAGQLPLWLAPVQIMVSNITDNQADYCRDLVEKLQEYGFRAQFDLRNEKIGFKIRQHTLAKVSYQLIIGDREMAGGGLVLRDPKGQQTDPLSWDQLVERLRHEVETKGLGV